MTDQSNPEPMRCNACEKFAGAFGILFGTVLILISIDIITGGAISSLISKPRIVEGETSDAN